MTDIAALRAETLALLARWTPIRSVAGNPAGLAEMARLLVEHLRTRLGAEIVEAGLAADPPIVHARIRRGGAARLLLYNMYDVMPAEATGWSVDPFLGGERDVPGLGRCFVGRGAENNKGPLAGMLAVTEALLASGVNADLEILLEGQEESGSGALRRYLLNPATPVARCEAALFPSFCEYGGGPPRIYLGFKGIAHGLIRAESGAWGGPSRAIHSSNAPWIANPAWLLVQALGRLGLAPTGSLGRIPLPTAFRPVFARLAATFDPAAELVLRATHAYAVNGTAEALLETVLTTTSLNIANLATDPRSGRAVTPAAATARFDLRTPPGIIPADVLAALRPQLAAEAPTGLSLQVEDAYPGHEFGAAPAGLDALVAAYKTVSAAPQIWPWAIGAAPAHAFAAVADSFLIGGLGYGGNAHGVDEFVTIAGIDRFLASLLHWLPATVATLSAARSRPRSIT